MAASRAIKFDNIFLFIRKPTNSDLITIADMQNLDAFLSVHRYCSMIKSLAVLAI